MKTKDRFVICSICGIQIKSFYTDGVADYHQPLSMRKKYCQKCLSIKRKKFPKGRGCYKPCCRCPDGEVRWYHKNYYGKIIKDCGNHPDNSIIESDEDSD